MLLFITMNAVEIRPVTRDNWVDFMRFFEAKSSPHHCWCATYRFANSSRLTKAQKKTRTQRFVDSGKPVGILAYDGGEPIGWCSVAPRETYGRLERSRTMPRVTLPETPTWTVLCFFVARSHRKQGVIRALLQGAVRYAREQGALVVEGYPFDSAAVSSTHRGHSCIFKAAGFRRDGTRWFLLL